MHHIYHILIYVRLQPVTSQMLLTIFKAEEQAAAETLMRLQVFSLRRVKRVWCVFWECFLWRTKCCTHFYASTYGLSLTHAQFFSTNANIREGGVLALFYPLSLSFCPAHTIGRLSTNHVAHGCPLYIADLRPLSVKSSLPLYFTESSLRTDSPGRLTCQQLQLLVLLQVRTTTRLLVFFFLTLSCIPERLHTSTRQWNSLDQSVRLKQQHQVDKQWSHPGSGVRFWRVF